MAITVTLWVLTYLAMGMGFAIAVLFNDKLCPKHPGELLLCWLFWLPIIFGHFFSKAWIGAVNATVDGKSR